MTGPKKRGPARVYAAHIRDIRVTPEWLARVDEYAERHGIKRAEAIRRLVEAALDGDAEA